MAPNPGKHEVLMRSWKHQLSILIVYYGLSNLWSCAPLHLHLNFGLRPTFVLRYLSPYWLDLSVAAAAKSLQSFPTLCDPIDGSPPGSPVPGILQARTMEWVAISFSNAWNWKVKVKSLSRVRLLATPWTAAHQAPLPMGFSRQEYWSGVPLKGGFANQTQSQVLLT